MNLYPDMEFDESNVGARPVRTASVDRIGIAGQFSRGPVTPSVVSQHTAKTVFGFDNTVGSAHLQAAIDQGANDFVVARAMAVARKARLDTTIVGTVVGAGTLKIYLKDGGTVTEVSVALTGGQTGSTVAAALKAAVVAANNAKFTAETPSGNATTNGKMNIVAKTGGLAGSSLQIKYELLTSTGLTFGPGTLTAYTSLAGGEDGPKAAKVMLLNAASEDVMELELNWPGELGDDVVATIEEGSETDLRDLIISFPGSGMPDEVFRDLDLTDVVDEDKLVMLGRSEIGVRGTVINDTRIPAVGEYAFANGSDGPATITTADFVAAIDQLESVQCTVIICPGLKPSGVDQWALNAVLVAQVEKLDKANGELAGLRIAVVSAPRLTAGADLVGIRDAQHIPNSKRTVMVVGWGTLARLPKFKRFGIDPSAVYAGHLMVTPLQVSPAARTSSPGIRGLTEVDTPGEAFWNDITRYRMDAIVFDAGFGGLHMLNGRSTSSDAAWYWVCYRRVYDRLRTNIWFGLQFIKSEPSNSALDAIVEETVNTALMQGMYGGMIRGYDSCVSNDTNNPSALRASGERLVDFGIEMIPPNDKTKIRMNRTIQGQVRLSA